MQIVNDNGCSWIKDLNPRLNIEVLEKNEVYRNLLLSKKIACLKLKNKKKINIKLKIVNIFFNLLGILLKLNFSLIQIFLYNLFLNLDLV